MANEPGDETAQRVRARPCRRFGRWATRTLATAMVGLVASTGAGMTGVVVKSQTGHAPAQPRAEAALPLGAVVSRDSPSKPNNASSGTGLSASIPTTITISRIGVRAKILALGVNSDNTVEVPPLDRALNAGWYKLGPSPGQIGNAVITGHVDSPKTGPAVFFRLRKLRPNDTITVSRADRSEVTFRVDRVQAYPKKAFPTELVYGPTTSASLRVITCGGTFDRQKRSYTHNVIVFATLVSFRQA